MKKVFIGLLLICVSTAAFSIEKPRVAVVPFNAIGVSESDAQILTSLFETALVKTDSYSVIEQNQVKEIIDAQAYSMSGCTDEACAIEFGELLAAEQIILGDVSLIGGKFVINAKVIDVAKGSNLKADNVEAESMADMTSATELLAYKLAGLTFSRGADVVIAEEFGEVLIETRPSGADILINGVKKGTSPDLIDRIPIGTVRIEAVKGDLYAVKDVNVSAETEMMTLTLKEMYGNLFIKSSDRDVEVFLDGESLGSLGTGFFEKIRIGAHKIELKGESAYWSGEAEVENGKSTKVDAYPRPYGMVLYSFPDGVTAEFKSREDSKIVKGSGELNLFTGTYMIKATGGRYEALGEALEIKRGDVIRFSPEMNTIAEKEREYFQALYDAAYSKKAIADESVPGSKFLISEIERGSKELAASQHDFPDLRGKFDDLYSDVSFQHQYLVNMEKLRELEHKRSLAQAEWEKVAGPRETADLFGYTFLGIGGAGLATAATLFFLSNSAYETYTSATSQTVAMEKRNEVRAMDFGMIISATVGGVFCVLSPISFLQGPEVAPVKESMQQLDLQIAELRARTN